MPNCKWWTAACQASMSITNTQSLLKFMSIKSVIPSNHLIPCHPLLLLSSIFPIIRVFSNKSVFCIRWPKYWRFSFSISPSNEYSGLISFKMDWFDLAVQGTLMSLLQHHSSKARKSALNILWKDWCWYFHHLMWRADLLEKTLMLGKIEDRRRRGWQRMRRLDGITDSMDMSLRRHEFE